jgi:hypothetical protein
MLKTVVATVCLCEAVLSTASLHAGPLLAAGPTVRWE